MGNTGQPEIVGLVLKSVGLPVAALLQFGWDGVGVGVGVGEGEDPEVHEAREMAPAKTAVQQ